MNKKKVGLHLDNKCPIDRWTKDYLLKMDPPVILVTKTTNEEDMAWLHANFPDATIICRVVYQKGMDHESYFASTLTLWWLARKYYPNAQVIVQLYNEPQFDYEGFGQSADGIKTFHEHWTWGHGWLKGQAAKDGHPAGSEMLFGFTPMAPGNKDIPVVEDPPGTRTFMEYCQDLIALCEYVFLHIYCEYPNQVNDPWYGNRMKQYKKWSQGKPIYITESALGTKDQVGRGPATVHWFKTYIVPDPQILGVTQWLGNKPGDPGQDPDFDVNRHFESDGKPRPIHDAILAYLSEPEEKPQPQEDTLTAEAQVRQYTDLIKYYASQNVLPASFVAGIILNESGGNPKAESPMNHDKNGKEIGTAKGLMQIMPWHFQEGQDPFDPETNIIIGTALLGSLYQRWGALEKAAAGYFGALDTDGNITEDTDATGTSGTAYVARVMNATLRFLDLDTVEPCPAQYGRTWREAYINVKGVADAALNALRCAKASLTEEIAKIPNY